MKKIVCMAAAVVLCFVLPLETFAYMPSVMGNEVETLAGTGSHGAWDGGLSQFNQPMGITYHEGRILIADTFNNLLRFIDADGEVGTFAGVLRETAPDNFPRGFYRDDVLLEAEFGRPIGLAFDSGGRIFVADSQNSAIRVIWEDRVFTFSGGLGAGFADGSPPVAVFNRPGAVAVGRGGYLYVADTGNHLIRRISPDGYATTIAGVPGQYGHEDGPAYATLFDSPMGIAVSAEGVIFVADTGNNLIRVIEDGVVRTLAGRVLLDEDEYDAFPMGGFSDGAGEDALFNMPMGLTIWNGYLIVADSVNHAIRAVSMEGEVVTLLGSGYPGYAMGIAESAMFHFPTGVFAHGNRLLIADTGNNKIRTVEISH